MDGSRNPARARRLRLAFLLGGLVALVALLLSPAVRQSAASPGTVCAPGPSPSGTGDWGPFGNATWTGNGLLTTSASAPGQPYGVSCGGASVYGDGLPTTDPHRITALSFDFNPNLSGASGTSPRLVVCFSDGAQCDSNGSLAPTTWIANTWTHVDGFTPATGQNAAWSNAGGSCPTLYNTTWSAIVACHPGASITRIAVVNDSGSQYPAGEQVLLNNLTVNNVVAHAAPPVFGVMATVAPATGQVLFKRPGDKRYRALRTVARLPYGTVVDASNGNLQIIAAKSRRGTGTESGNFYGASFVLTQGKDGYVQAALAGAPAGCRPTEAGHLAGKPFNLWGHVHGHYRTRGHYGSASVQGTIWLTEELCDGTYFHVVRGTLRIRDFTRHRTVTITAGQSYLAPSALPAKPRKVDGDGDHDGD